MLRYFFFSLAWLCLTGIESNGQKLPGPPLNAHHLPGFKALETGFLNIPDSVQTSVYWYWVSGNISKEGVIRDLEAMKKVGINRAFIGNIGLDEVPYSKIKMFSEDWWDIMHTALKTATRLNIEIGIFNSPGWSQSGGPWVKPQEAMRYLTSSEVTVKGPFLLKRKLVKPQPDFQDVKVIAYPVADNYHSNLTAFNTRLISFPAIDSLKNLMDDNESTGIRLKKDQQLSLDLTTISPYNLQSIVIVTTKQPVLLEGEIQAEINGKYVTIKKFSVDRTNPALNTGFIPYGPASISIPNVKSTNFRVTFKRISANSGINELKFSTVPVVENYLEKSLAKMWPTPHPFWSAYQWEQQSAETSKYTIDATKVLDITKHMAADGTLNWKVPFGTWIIERTGMTPTKVTNAPAPPEGRGLEVDKMSKEHISSHFNTFLGQILKRIPAEDRRTWKVVVEDSYETGGQNWTDNLVTEFKQAYKYDPTPYLPVLHGKVVGSEDISDRFLWDLRRLIADDVSYKYVGGLREISHKNGLTTWLENYGHWGFPGEFLQYGGQSDEVGGEFWSEGDLGDIENRAASSSAHIYGKVKVSAESFTASGSPFSRYPAMFKKRGDRFFSEGINNTLLHVYVQQPLIDTSPGLTAWFGVEFNRLNTWFFDMDDFLQYLKRCNMMLQQGQYVADAAYFIGEDVPKMTGITDPALPQGYSFDYINGEVIREKLSVKNGKLTLPNGINYRILVLPKLQTMRPELLARIKALVQQGAVVLGPKPTRSPSLKDYPSSDRQVQNMANEMWGNIDGTSVKTHSYGKGMVISGMDMQSALNLAGITPDLHITKSDSILFIHRHLSEGELYFVSNQKNVTVNIDAEFRITNKSPELWDAVLGTIRPLPDYHQTASATSVPLQLAPFESAFVIFRTQGAAGNLKKLNYPMPANTFTLTRPWMINFDKDKRGPAQSVKFETLTDWAQNSNDSIKYFSGTAYYRTVFNMKKVEKDANYFVDLGLVRSVGKVKVNGVEVGGVWTPPYHVDITKAIKPGDNQLEIKVVNNWVNRLIGDSRMPVDKRPTSVIYGPDPKSGLQSSGLLGPVRIDEIKY